MAVSLGVSESSAVLERELLVDESTRDLQFGRCEMLLIEVGNRGTGIVRETRVKI
jgi:hypothetical protein